MLYLVLDGRANFDTERAAVFEAFERVTDEEALAYFEVEYVQAGMDAVLFNAAQDELLILGSTEW